MMTQALVLLDAYALEIALAALVFVPILALAVRSRRSRRATGSDTRPAPLPQTAAVTGPEAIGPPPEPAVADREAAPPGEPVAATVASTLESAPEPVAEADVEPDVEPVVEPIDKAAGEPVQPAGDRVATLGVPGVTVPDAECLPVHSATPAAAPAVEPIEVASTAAGLPPATDTAPAAEEGERASDTPMAEPAAAVDAPCPVDVPAAVAAVAPVPAETPPSGDSAPTRLLVVDDSAVVRAKLRKLLEGAGYQVEMARDGREALAMLTSGRYALLVTDLEMPAMSGFELIAAVRAMAEVGPVPIVAISGHDDLEAYRARLPGVSGLFRKPWSDADLLAQLGAVLARPRAPAPAAGALPSRPIAAAELTP